MTEADFIAHAERLTDGLRRFIAKYQPAEADDLLQDTLVRAYTNLDKYDPAGGQFQTWLYTIAKNLCFSRYRQKRRRGEQQLDEPLTDDGLTLHDRIAVPGPDIVERLDTKHRYEDMLRRIERLPTAFRRPVELRDLHHLKYEEIAAALDMPLGSVKSKINRGRAMLRGEKPLKRQRPGPKPKTPMPEVEGRWSRFRLPPEPDDSPNEDLPMQTEHTHTNGHADETTYEWLTPNEIADLFGVEPQAIGQAGRYGKILRRVGEDGSYEYRVDDQLTEHFATSQQNESAESETEVGPATPKTPVQRKVEATKKAAKIRSEKKEAPTDLISEELYAVRACITALRELPETAQLRVLAYAECVLFDHVIGKYPANE